MKIIRILVDKKSLLRFILSVLFLVFILGGQGYSGANLSNKVTKYAVLVGVATDANKKLDPKFDPIGVNCVWVQMVNIYKILENCGYQDKNIYILYGKAGVTPDFDEPLNRSTSKKIKKKHFSGGYRNEAIKANIEEVLKKVKEKADDNDRLVFYIMAHGSAQGRIQLSDSPLGSPMTIFQNWLGGFKSKTNIFLFETCFGGLILDKTTFDNAVCLSTTSSHTSGWLDREFSDCTNFLKAKTEKKYDKNNDKIVDCYEALEVIKKWAKEYEPGLLDYVRTKYKFKGRPYPPETINKISLIPVMKVGKDYVKANLGESSGGKRMACDLKGAKKIPICTACGKTLLGYRCLDCKKMFALDDGADKKCPECGSAKLCPAKLVVEKKCFFCKGPIKEEQMCVKRVYSCPNHPDVLHLKPVRCPKCKEKLVLKETVSCKVITYYECRKCGHTQDSSGKCPKCKKTLKRKRKCEKSGTFPHVDEREWKKQHK